MVFALRRRGVKSYSDQRLSLTCRIGWVLTLLLDIRCKTRNRLVVLFLSLLIYLFRSISLRLCVLYWLGGIQKCWNDMQMNVTLQSRNFGAGLFKPFLCRLQLLPLLLNFILLLFLDLCIFQVFLLLNFRNFFHDFILLLLQLAVITSNLLHYSILWCVARWNDC